VTEAPCPAEDNPAKRISEEARQVRLPEMVYFTHNFRFNDGGTNMSDEPKVPGHDWSKVDALARRNQNEIVQKPQDLPLTGVEDRIEVLKRQRVGILGKFKAGSIDRNTALAEIQALSDAHLEATKYKLKRALEVDRQRVDLVAQKYIYEITEEHLRDMREMGIHNFEARMQTLLRLNAETAALLKQAEAQDVPTFIQQKTFDAIIAKYEEFLKTITADEIKVGK